MNKKGITFIIVFCAICFVLWWLRKTPERRSTNIIQVEAPKDVATQLNSTKPLPAPGPAAVQVVSNGQSNAEASNAVYNAYVAELQVSMDFYGKVVDENTNAIAGASVSFDWNENPAGFDHKTYATLSDPNGLFSIHGARGAILKVIVTKQDYYSPPPGFKAFRYSAWPRFSPDQSNPVIFQLRKKGEVEPLIRLAGPMGADRQYRLDTKGTPTEISFYSGQRVSEGQGNFRIQYWMEAPPNPNDRQFKWRCRITVPGGGLQVTTDEFPFAAPESGYMEAVEINSETAREMWSDRVNQTYYFHLGDGKYGRVKFNLVCSDNPFFGVEAFVNPSGSRTLEYDKSLPGNILVDQSSP